jgi:para-aminobenzoate synthetase component 1
LTQGADPAELVEDFLASNGLPVRNLDRSAALSGRPGGSVCGAAVFVSAAAGAAMIGAAPGRRTPAPRVPDVAVVVYAHGGARPADPVPAPPPEVGGPWRLGAWRASWTPEHHADAVRAVRAAIARGDVYQVNLVAGLAGARYGAVLPGDGWAIASASPETLVQVRDGRVITRPIKGTRPATAVGRRELLTSAKERAEHIMIVDLQRNDLARLPGVGPVRVERLYEMREWCGLWQAESTVAATLTGPVGLAALLRAVCPGGSVTGAPKIAALEQIARLEPVGRGASMGALGWVGVDRVDLGLSIRTVAVDGERVHLWAGGGITWGSDPWAEVAEAAAKAAPLRAALAGPRPPGP